MDLHRADGFPAARCQHLPAVVDDLSFIHELPGQSARKAHQVDRDAELRAAARFGRHLGLSSGDGPLRDLDDGAADPDRIRPRPSHQQEFQRGELLDDDHPDSDDAVPGGRGGFLDLHLPAANRHFLLHHRLFPRNRRARHDRLGAARAVGHHHRRYLDVVSVHHGALPGGLAVDSRLPLRGGGSGPGQRRPEVLVHHAAARSAVPHARGAVQGD